jgi:hypothetical protein
MEVDLRFTPAWYVDAVLMLSGSLMIIFSGHKYMGDVVGLLGGLVWILTHYFQNLNRADASHGFGS